MALIPENEYPGQTQAGNSDYPQGSAVNDSSPGAFDGTPFERAWLNDMWGFLQALLVNGGITPSGDPDTAVASQYLQGLKGVRPMSTLSGTSDYTRLCRIRFTAQAQYTNMVLRVLDGIESTADNDACELVIRARQEAALNSNPVVTLKVRSLDGAGSIAHNSFAAYYSTVSATESIIDVYVTSASGNLDAFYQALTINNNGGEVTFYDSDGTATEANITGGTFDVTSQAARGEIVYSETLALGGDYSVSGRLTVTRDNGGNWCKFFIPEDTSLPNATSHTSNVIIPSAYRPVNGINAMSKFLATNNGEVLQRTRINAGGDIYSEQTDSDFVLKNYSISDDVTLEWFVFD